jgi:dTMP kinase
MQRGRLISFEGLDGAGKSTQLTMLGQWLEQRHIPYLLTREPGGTALGQELRHLLFERTDLTIAPLAEALLFQADRAQHFAATIEPALAAGTLVITDRCYDSSIAYQGGARGLGMELIEELSLIATGGRSPDLTILLDLTPEQVSERINQHDRDERSHFDAQPEAFHQRLRAAFLELARRYPDRIKVIDASLPAEELHQRILVLVQEQLS